MLSSLNNKMPLRALSLLFALTLLWGCSDGSDDRNDNDGPDRPDDPNLIYIDAGPNFETDLQEALINAQPKNIIILPAGTFDMTSATSLTVSNVTVRGQGQDKTILNYAGQQGGGESFLVTSNNVTVEDFAIVDPPSDGIKFNFSNGVNILRMRVEWTCGACTENGAYAIYPVNSKNVLIEDSISIGSSDAGIYVGQSDNIIVRRNTARLNVAGIEIENSTRSDVYDNIAEDNTGGILAFDLPNLSKVGEGVRIFNNTVRNNNTANFAGGGIVGNVPAGTGILAMAFDDVEIFDNVIENNISSAVIVTSYALSGRPNDDPTYDPAIRRVNIHDNQYSGNATDPQDLAAALADAFADLGGIPEIFYDGIEETEPYPDSQRICAREADSVTMGVFVTPGTGEPSVDSAFFDCAHPSLPEVVLDTPEDIEDGETPPTDEEIEALCTPEEGSTTPNFAALEVNCPTLSGYNLYADATEPRVNPNDGIPYNLITPLFTDYAEKYRVIYVPEGKQGAYSRQEVMDFPVGTIIAKTFTMPNDFQNPAAGEVIIETRVLLRREDGWAALPYIWREDVSDADLSLTGGSRELTWIHTDGLERSTNYLIPNANECKTCHGKLKPETGSGQSQLANVMELIGPKARFLNEDNVYDGVTVNQLRYMEQQGILVGVPEDLDSIDTVPDWEDTSLNLEDRAKGYLDINCAHCHRPTGFASNSALFLDYWREVDESYGICKTTVAAGAGSGPYTYDIVPGDASTSIMPFRMDSNEPEILMPEIGRTIIHDEGVDLVNEWIDSLSGGCP